MARGGNLQCWAELIPDALVIIFMKLSLEEKLTVVPRVCKSWGKVIMGPFCWKEINIEDWSNEFPEHADKMVEMLIMRSSGSFRKLCFTRLQNDSTFSLIAQHAGALETLHMYRSEMSNSTVISLAGCFSKLTSLDVSYCNNLGASGLEAIGENCKFLLELIRKMHPADTQNLTSQDDEAHAIAATMPKLKRLEIAYLLITKEGAAEILSSCPDLEVLDMRGCWNAAVDDELLREKYPRVNVLGPFVEDDDGEEEEDADSDYSSEDFGRTPNFVLWGSGDEDSDEVTDDEELPENMEIIFLQPNHGLINID